MGEHCFQEIRPSCRAPRNHNVRRNSETWQVDYQAWPAELVSAVCLTFQIPNTVAYLSERPTSEFPSSDWPPTAATKARGGKEKRKKDPRVHPKYEGARVKRGVALLEIVPFPRQADCCSSFSLTRQLLNPSSPPRVT